METGSTATDLGRWLLFNKNASLYSCNETKLNNVVIDYDWYNERCVKHGMLVRENRFPLKMMHHLELDVHLK